MPIHKLIHYFYVLFIEEISPKIIVVQHCWCHVDVLFRVQESMEPPGEERMAVSDPGEKGQGPGEQGCTGVTLLSRACRLLNDGGRYKLWLRAQISN